MMYYFGHTIDLKDATWVDAEGKAITVTQWMAVEETPDVAPELPGGIKRSTAGTK